MNEARLQIVLGKGEKGVSLLTLSKIVGETNAFLKSLGNDLGEKNDWKAFNFRDGSVIFEVETEASNAQVADLWRRGIRSIVTDDLGDDEINVIVSRATKNCYQKVLKSLPDRQKIQFGVFEGQGETPELLIERSAADADFEDGFLKPSPAVYHGEIQGTVHALYKEASPQKYFVVRELCSKNLVKCFFSDSLYLHAVELLKEEQGVIFFEGELHESSEGVITKIIVSNFTPAPIFDGDWFNDNIGAFSDCFSGGNDHAQSIFEARE